MLFSSPEAHMVAGIAMPVDSMFAQENETAWQPGTEHEDVPEAAPFRS